MSEKKKKKKRKNTPNKNTDYLIKLGFEKKTPYQRTNVLRKREREREREFNADTKSTEIGVGVKAILVSCGEKERISIGLLF